MKRKSVHWIAGISLLALAATLTLRSTLDGRSTERVAGSNTVIGKELASTPEVSLPVHAPQQEASAPGASNPPSRRPAAPATLAEQLRGSKSLRQAALTMASRPEVGGISYAAYATSICRVARTIAASSGVPWHDAQPRYSDGEDSMVYLRRSQAFEKIKHACGEFSNDELAGAADIELSARAAREKDLVHEVKAKARAAADSSDPRARRDALSAVVSTQDPLILDGTLERLLLVRGGDGKLGYWIEGQHLPLQEADTFRAALSVLPCRFGLICDERAPSTLQVCLTSGVCGVDRIEQVRRTLPPEAAAKYIETLDKLEHYVRSGQVSMLLPGMASSTTAATR